MRRTTSARGRERTPPTAVEPSELGFGHLLETGRDAVVVADDAGRIALWNAQAANIFGFSVEEARGMPTDALVPARLASVHPLSAERVRAVTSAAARGPATPPDVDPPSDAAEAAEEVAGFADRGDDVIEVVALRRDGAEIAVEVLLKPIPGPRGRGRYALAVLRDVTERGRLLARAARERERATEAGKRLADADEALAAFAYVVGHDLKEPARAIEAYLRAIDEDHADGVPVEARVLLARALGASGRLQALVSGLIDLARASREDLAAVPVRVEDAVASDACRLALERHVREREASLVVEPGIPSVLATLPLLAQVVGNLVGNAIKHNPRASPRVRVSGSPVVDAAGARVHVLVEDYGPGFPEAVVERFAEGAKPLPAAGSGFGLVIARRAVERLGGALWVGVAPDGGGAVHVMLPAAAGSAVAVQPQPAAGPAAPRDAEGAGRAE